MGRTLSQEAMDTLYPDPNKQKLQRSKDVFAAASNGGQIQPTPYELASGAKAPTPPANLGAVQKNNTPGAPLGLTVGSMIDKNATTYDETSFRNPQVKARGADTPRMGAKLGPGVTLTQDGQGNVSFFGADGKKLTPAEARLSARQSGQKEQTGVFSGYSKTTGPGGMENFSPNFSTPTQPAPQQGGNPFFIKSTAAKGLVPQHGTASAIPGMQQNPAATMFGGNWTGMLNQDDAIFKAKMAALDRGESLGPLYTPPGQPGGGTYQPESIMDKLSTQRDSLFRQVSEMDRTSGISRDSSIGDIIAHKLKTKGMRDEIDRIDKEVLGRTDFANKIQTQLLQNIGAQALQGMKEAGDTSRNNADNSALWNIHKMREAAETGRKIFETNAATGSAAAKLDAEAAKAEQQRRDNIFMELMKANTDAMKAGNGPLDIKAAVQATRGLYDEYYGKPGKNSAIGTIK